MISTKLWLILPCYDLIWRHAPPESEEEGVDLNRRRRLEKREKTSACPEHVFPTSSVPTRYMGDIGPCDTYLIQYHTNIQLNTYKPILCNITQILYTRGHLTYSVMSPYTIRDISCYVVCKMTDQLILLCTMLRCTVLHSTRPHPQK